MNNFSAQYIKGVPLMDQTRAMQPHLEHTRQCAAKRLIGSISQGNAQDFTNSVGVELKTSFADAHIRYMEKAGLLPFEMTAPDGASITVYDGRVMVPGVIGSVVSLETGYTNTGGQISASRLREIGRIVAV